MFVSYKSPRFLRAVGRDQLAGGLFFLVIAFWLLVWAGYNGLISFCGNVSDIESCLRSTPIVLDAMTAFGILATPLILAFVIFRSFFVLRMLTTGKIVEGRTARTKNVLPNSGLTVVYTYSYRGIAYENRARIWWEKEWTKNNIPYALGDSIEVIVDSRKPVRSLLRATYDGSS